MKRRPKTTTMNAEIINEINRALKNGTFSRTRRAMENKTVDRA